MNKDITEFTLEETLEAIKQTFPRNEKQAKVRCSYINGYRRWTFNDDSNIFKEVNPEFYNQFKPAQ